MEICGRCPCNCRQFVGQNFLSFFLVSHEKILFRSMRHRLKENICVGRQCASKPRPTLSLTSASISAPTSEELWNVIWLIEAELEVGQQLYLTGDLTVLGDWQPDMAVQMHSVDNSRLWKTEVKVPSGVNIKYNYFIINDERASPEIFWRPGPETSLSVPCGGRMDRRISVRDSWIVWTDIKMPPSVWGSWVDETKPSISIDQDRDEIFKALQLEHQKDRENDVDIKTVSTLVNKDFVEEPWLFLSSNVFHLSENKVKIDHPSEIQSSDNEHLSSGTDNGNSSSKPMSVLVDAKNQMLKDDGKSTTILINTSICTMQRIAVLEDDKLVEILLEPVKSDVQCDSVYIGVVTQLLPQMRGALVDIGSSRPAFLDMDETKAPYIFPPFHRRSMKEKNDISLELDKHQIFSLRKNPDDDFGAEDLADLVSSHQSKGIMFDDQEENENENENTDDLDALYEKPTMNGSVLDDERFDVNLGKINNLITNSLDEDVSDLNPNDQSNYWSNFCKGSRIIVQVYKEGLGTKRPSVTAYPHLRSRFWVLLTRCNRIGVSRKIIGSERVRLKVIAKILQPPGFGLTVRTVAAGHSWKELHKDLKGLLSTWKTIMETAKSAVLAADEGLDGAVPAMLHRAMGQTLSVVQDYFNEKVKKMVVDSRRTYHEVTNYLQDIAPDLCNRVELYDKRNLLFREFKIEEEINSILSKRVPLSNGGSLVIEQTEALVSIDVNGGHVMFGHGTSPAKAVLDVNLTAAKQIARELRLRDIGGIIVVDFIDMDDESNRRLVYEEMKRSVERDRSTVKISELSKCGLMEITRKRVRPSVTFMVSEPCACCQGTGRVEALETTFSKIEQEICRLLSARDQEAKFDAPMTWPKFLLRVDYEMCNYLTSGKKSKLGVLSSSLKAWILLKVARGFTRGYFEVKQVTDEKKNPAKLLPILRQSEASSNNIEKQVKVVTIKKGKGRKSSRKLSITK